MDLISIIIPTFNRAHLIKETLDSILRQTYSCWECIIIDDGSSDNTEGVLQPLLNEDQRFKFFKRPQHRLKGANTCRNIGLEKSKGKYIVFFDSDDLMTENHLKVKYKAIVANSCDYVITRTKYFNKSNAGMDTYYTFKTVDITPYNYITQKVNWVTLDVCIRADVAKSVDFNEVLTSGQEYNYYCKLVHKTINAVYLNEVVSLRRYHEESIRSKLKTQSDFDRDYFRLCWFTYLDLDKQADVRSKKYLLKKCVTKVYVEKEIILNTKIEFLKAVRKVFGNKKCFYFLLMYISLKTINKGYYFRTKFLE